MLAFLWQEGRAALARWLDWLELATDVGAAEVETQFTIPSGKRPDIAIRSNDSVTLVESKLRSGFGETQIADYVDFLAQQDGRRALVLLTQRPEVVPPRWRPGHDILSSLSTNEALRAPLFVGGRNATIWVWRTPADLIQ